MIAATGIVVALAAALVTAPHLVRLDGAPALLAAGTWLAALVLRAVLVVSITVAGFLILPSTGALHALTHWCWHFLLPVVQWHEGVSGHTVADAALLVPVVLLAASAASVLVALWRAARAVGRLLRTGMAGGPSGSLIVCDDAVLIAAAGLRRPRIVVSAGALTALDDEELAAGLAHERGHILRRHRWLLVVTEVLKALARPLPGTPRAAHEVAFHLERDADRYALACRAAPADLARAICKAAAGADPGLTVSPLAGGDATRRVRELLDAPPPRRTAGIRGLLAALLASATALLAIVPAAVATTAQRSPGTEVEHCDEPHGHSVAS